MLRLRRWFGAAEAIHLEPGIDTPTGGWVSTPHWAHHRVDLQITENAWRRSLSDRAQHFHDRCILAVHGKAQTDTPIDTAVLRRYGLAASDGHSCRAGQFFQLALQIGTGDRIAVAFE